MATQGQPLNSQMATGQATKQPASQPGQFGPSKTAQHTGRAGTEVSLKSKFSLIEYLHAFFDFRLILTLFRS